MSVLEVKNLNKNYPAFSLKDVGFSLEKGKITGFIGRNGAGKSTTLNSLFNFVHPDSGEIRFFDMDMKENEEAVKQRVGFVAGAIDYYQKKKLKTITKITKSFYENWDESAYEKYIRLFQLDENKSPSQLSAGMRVKYVLALALSHQGDLLILDEPTSGLDPVSRDELLDIFMDLCEEGKTILFSTHIISDLEKCADRIIYIKNGEICADDSLKNFENSYALVPYEKNIYTAEQEAAILGKKRSKTQSTALIKKQDCTLFSDTTEEIPLEEIMLHLEKEAIS